MNALGAISNMRSVCIPRGKPSLHEEFAAQVVASLPVCDRNANHLLQNSSYVSSWHERDMSALPTNVRSRSLERLNTDVAFGPFMTQTGSGGGAVTRDGLSGDLMMLFFARVRRLFR
jgi:hypothetical protein